MIKKITDTLDDNILFKLNSRRKEEKKFTFPKKIPYVPFNIENWEARYKDKNKLSSFNSKKSGGDKFEIVSELQNYLTHNDVCDTKILNVSNKHFKILQIYLS